MALDTQEKYNLRLVTGEVNPETQVVLPVKGCIPLQKSQAGTFSTNGTDVIGVGSDFEDEFEKDRTFLYSPTLNEIRMVKEIQGALKMVLHHPFSANVAGDSVFMVRSAGYKSVITKNNGGATGKLQEVSLFDLEVDIREFTHGCAPFTYDATGTVFSFNISA